MTDFNAKAGKDERIRCMRIEEASAPDGSKGICAIMKDPLTHVETPWSEKSLLDTIRWMQDPANANLRPPGMTPAEFQDALVRVQAAKAERGIALDVGKYEPPKGTPFRIPGCRD